MSEETPAAEPWSFGVAPLDQVVALAPLLRRIAGLLQALEQPDESLDRLHDNLVAAERDLDALVSSDPQPRVGDDAPAHRRPYVDHSRDIGAFNPCFPEYDLVVDGHRASGTVTFPVVYEGPPGVVHGGVQATFFDSVMQHHNCDVGVAGKTTSLSVRFRRPAPVGVPLAFTVEREATDRRIVSTAHLLQGEELLATASMEAVAGDRADLPSVSPRRPG